MVGQRAHDFRRADIDLRAEFGHAGGERIASVPDMFVRLTGERYQIAVLIVQGFEDSLDSGNRFAVESNLVANKPLQRSRDSLFEALNQLVQRAAGTRINAPNGRDFGLRGIAGMNDRKQVSNTDPDPGVIGSALLLLRIAGANTVSDGLNDGR